jgi:hypothetical protein
MDEDDYIIEDDEPPAYEQEEGAAFDPGDSSSDDVASPAKKSKKKGAIANPCRGKVTKEKGKAAKHVPGDVAAPVSSLFEPEAIADQVDLWWENDGGDKFVIRTVTDKGAVKWSKWPMAAIRLKIRQCVKEKMGRILATKPREDELVGEVDRVLLWVRENRMVEAVMSALAGYKAGIHELSDGRQVIVRMSPRLVEPQEGEWPTIQALIDGRLDLSKEGGNDVDQSVYFHAWAKTAYESLMFGEPGSHKPGHIMAIFGPGGCGKSRLQINLITPLLGGRVADPTAFMTGDDTFNSDMMGAEHQCVEELQRPSWGASDRVNLSESMKRIVATESKRMRLMRSDPMTVNPFWRMSITMNNDPDKIRAFPMLTPDFRDKVVLLLAAKRPMPMPTTSVAQQKAFNDAIRAELPAYAHWLLNEFTIPAAMLMEDGQDATRFGFAAFQHPLLAAQLFDDTPPAQLLRLIDQGVLKNVSAGERKIWEMTYPHNTSGRKPRGGEWENIPRLWEGTAEKLEELLTGQVPGWESSVGKAALKLLHKAQITTLLSRLREDCSDRVDKRDRAEAKGWAIEAPQSWQPDAEG